VSANTEGTTLTKLVTTEGVCYMSTTTKTSKVLAALSSGEELTGKQISARFGVGNPRAMVSSMRMNGYPVYANQRTDSKGRVKTKYRLGTAPRAVIAAGYQAIAAQNASA